MQLHVSQPNGSINEKWRVENDGKGGFIIRSAANPTMVLNIIGANFNEGTGVCIWPYVGANNDTWSIVPG